jgi:hypothetical protein
LGEGGEEVDGRRKMEEGSKGKKNEERSLYFTIPSFPPK